MALLRSRAFLPASSAASRSRADVLISCSNRYFTYSGVGRTCGGDKNMFQDASIKAKKNAYGISVPTTTLRTLGGADQFTFQPCCAAAFPSNECPQASLLARQTCAASRRAFSRAQHLLYNSCTSVTDACPWPHRVSDALPGKAAAHCHLF